MPVFQEHHPNRQLYPNWTIAIPRWLHQVITKIQRMKATEENLAIIRGFIDALEYEYLQKRRVLDEKSKTNN